MGSLPHSGLGVPEVLGGTGVAVHAIMTARS